MTPEPLAPPLSPSLPSRLDSDRSPAADRGVFWLEVAFIFFLFYLYAGTPVPDVNEAHYLAKAKSYWNPAWCAGDPFLESADAHLCFYWTFGWLTLLFPLPAVAWIGRVVTWALLAWSWCKLSRSLTPMRYASILSAGLFLGFLHYGHMAGEWVVGGVEAKGFAYVLVLLGLEALVVGRWNRVWIFLGGAAAFHVLVGGWSVLAAGAAWLTLPRRERMPLLNMLPGLVLGGAISLAGLLPVLLLNRGVDPAVVAEANRIYVFERLPHHLVMTQFPRLFIFRFAALTAVWIVLSVFFFARWEVGRRRLDRFIGATVVLTVIGGLLSLAARQDVELGAKLLRYYWFRLSDVMVPLGVALGLTEAIVRLYRPGQLTRFAWAAGAAAMLAAVALGTVVVRNAWDPRPGADKQSLPMVSGDRNQTWWIYRDWADVCRWVDAHLPPDAHVLAPAQQQTFKWYAGHGDVVCVKDIPQDARGVVDWYARYNDIYLGDQQTPVIRFSPRRMERLALQYDFGYVVVRRRRGFPRFDAELLYANRRYAVYRIPREEWEPLGQSAGPSKAAGAAGLP